MDLSKEKMEALLPPHFLPDFFNVASDFSHLADEEKRKLLQDKEPDTHLFSPLRAALSPLT